MSNSKTFLEAQLELEGLKITDDNKIVKIQTNHFDIEKKNDSESPKVMAVKFDYKIEVFYSKLLPLEIVSKLEQLDKKTFFQETEKISEILQKNNQFNDLGHYVAYIFPESFEMENTDTKVFTGSDDELIKEFDESFFKKFPMVYATMKGGKIVACCVSSRESDRAGEAWIFTLPEYRKQGFGFKAVQLWAKELQKKGKFPFYTHEVSNIASQKLAERLELKKVFETISYE